MVSVPAAVMSLPAAVDVVVAVPLAADRAIWVINFSTRYFFGSEVNVRDDER